MTRETVGQDKIIRIAPVRWLYALLGVSCVGMGAVGVVVPGMPTTVFLIMASYLFTRSCPWLEQRLIRNRFFGPFLCYLDRRSAMPLKARVISLSLMWLSIVCSVALLASRGTHLAVLGTIIAAGLVGSWFIHRLGREPQPEATLEPDADMDAVPLRCPVFSRSDQGRPLRQRQ